jgi:hypothetical protein
MIEPVSLATTGDWVNNQWILAFSWQIRYLYSGCVYPFHFEQFKVASRLPGNNQPMDTQPVCSNTILVYNAFSQYYQMLFMKVRRVANLAGKKDLSRRDLPLACRQGRWQRI